MTTERGSYAKKKSFLNSSYFGRYVIRSPAKCFRRFISRYPLFTHTEIRNFDMSVLIQQNVIQFKIPVNDSATVKVKQTDGDFGGIKNRDGFFEFSTLLYLKHEISSVHVFHDEIQSILQQRKRKINFH